MMSLATEAWGIHFDESELLCKDGCGYYGNPAWHGCCSKCWRERSRKQQPSTVQERIQKKGASPAEGSNGYVFAKFEEKKSSEKWRRANTVKKFFCSTKASVKADVLPRSLDLKTSFPFGNGDFTDFLKSLRKPATQFIQKHCASFIENMQAKQDMLVQEQSDMVQDFYQSMITHFQDYPAEECDRLMDNIEKMVMTRLYKSVFCPDNSPDEQKDLLIQSRIRSLHWVTPEMLRVPLSEEKPEVNEKIFYAITAMIEIDSKRAPQDKLSCISRASNSIFTAIQSSNQEPATADDFLSCLIYAVLKANPPRLHSNLQYITRFCYPKRLMTGEAGYCFTSLGVRSCLDKETPSPSYSCAVTFIEKLDAPSLNLTRAEFDRCMNGQRSEARKIPLCLQQSDWPGLKQIQLNQKLLEELWSRQETVIRGVQSLEQELKDWCQCIGNEVQAIISRYPLAVPSSSFQSSESANGAA